MKKIIIASVVIIALLGGSAFWYLVIRDEKLSVSTSNVDSSKSAQDIKEQTTPDGDWIVKQQDDVFIGYEIKEVFGGETIEKTATGTSKDVEGSFTLTGSVISNGTISVNMTKLMSGESRRDSTMENSGLETNKFPSAKFEQSQELTIQTPITKGTTIELDIPGTMTLHGQTKDVIFPLKALWDGKVITLSGELNIELVDFDIQAPQNAFVSVKDQGKLKLQLLFIPKI